MNIKKSLIRALIAVAISGLINSCSTLKSSEKSSLPSQAMGITSPIKAPDIAYQPEKAFFPLRLDTSDGEIKPSFQNEICAKKILGICYRWEKRLLFFSELDWFFMNGFGLMKLPEIK